MKSKVKDKDKINKNKYDKLESIYTSLTQMFNSLPEKGDNCISFMKNCQKDHESQIEEITSELSKLEALSQRIEDYHQSLMKQIQEELKESSDVEDNEDEKEKIKEIQKYQEDELYANVDARETMKNDQKNIVIIKNLLQSAELKAEKDEEKRKLFKFQNQLDDLFKEIEIEEIRQGEQIDNIDKEVDDSLYRIEKANNQELEKAARIAINRRRLSYQIGLGATFGAIGSVVPGIGNAIGAALGALIGYGIYRVDMHRLNKATKNKEKLGNEIDNK
jgi:chromosome segregation ATPase